ncbi:MAG: DoxX family protein [Candidatus Acidiferrum sp.]|jgi:putative oxidoreductase
MATTNPFSSSPVRELNLELLIMRIACSLPFIYHGAAILFGVFGGPGPHNFAAFMHAPDIVGYLVGLAQFAGGIAILIGAPMRIGCVCVIIVMLGAVFMVHLANGYDISHQGMEYALTELLLSIGLLLAGPGRFSLAAVLPTPLRNL